VLVWYFLKQKSRGNVQMAIFGLEIFYDDTLVF
jgi:hypothetical protein